MLDRRPPLKLNPFLRLDRQRHRAVECQHVTWLHHTFFHQKAVREIAPSH